MNQITADMKIGDILKQNPEAAKILMSFGMHCLGCAVASGESIGQAAQVHGIDLKKLLESLNQK